MNQLSRGERLGKAIQLARQRCGLSIRKLAEAAGVTHSYVAKVEAGRFQSVSPDNLAAFARALDVPAADLYALGGYKLPEALPTFAPYLRTRYREELPEQAIDQLNEYFELLRAKYADSDVSDDEAHDDPAGARGGSR